MVVPERVPILVGSKVLTELAEVLKKSKATGAPLSAPDVRAIAEHAVSSLSRRGGSFEEQNASLRELLADLCEASEQWSQAARALAGIQLEGQRILTPEYRLTVYVRTAQLFLEDDDSVQAEAFVNRASLIDIAQISDPNLRMRYKICVARVQDHKRRFAEACRRYYELSHLLLGDDRLEVLKSAVICGVLAPAGSLRSQLLNMLYKDERVSILGECFGTLEQMYLNRMLRPADVKRFQGLLKPHQLATLADGTTVLDRAVLEHNLLCASLLYRNISLEALSRLLGVAPLQAEKSATRMIQEGRLAGSIDQGDGVLTFSGSSTDGQSWLPRWDSRVAACLSQLNDLAELCIQKSPSVAVSKK